MPTSQAEVVNELNAIEALATLTDWRRSALVYLLREKLTEEEVVALGVRGLAKTATVRIYTQAWQEAMENGQAKAPRWGRTVSLPTVPFPRTRTGTDGHSTLKGAATTIQRIQERHGAAVILDAVDLDANTAEKVVNRVARSHPNVVARRGTELREAENRNVFDQIRSEREAAGEPTTRAHDLLGGRRPFMEGQAALHQIRSGTRVLGHLRDDLTSTERKELLTDIDDASHFLDMVSDLYRSKSNLDSELAAFLATEGDEQ
jgi:hypothetical protein